MDAKLRRAMFLVAVADALPGWLAFVALWLIGRATRMARPIEKIDRGHSRGILGLAGAIVDSAIGINRAKEAAKEAQRRAMEAVEDARKEAQAEAAAKAAAFHQKLRLKMAAEPGRYHHITGNAMW